MIEALEFMAAPFAACLVLLGIHAYLGLHVLLREVIFVDLALAQIAAFGSLVALAAGHAPGTPASLTFSLTATLVGAAIFSLSRTRGSRVPQESIIGITFVVASAASILVADRAPEGAEQIKELLAGSILWVTWPTVIKILLIYVGVGLVQWLLRRTFVLVSEDPEEAFSRGLDVRWWDFLFYATFGLVITFAVEIGGVLMVFSFLVGPAIIALATSSSWPVRIAVGYGVGTLASALGLAASYRWDLPAGPAIVCTLGLFLAMFAILRAATRGRRGERPAR